MALNVTFAGFASRNSGSLGNGDIQYQAYFYKVNAGSSSSKWNNVRTIESGASKGYWSCNLGDGDWLTQSGNIAAGDKVIIVFWRTGNDRNANCLILDEWGAFEITLTSATVYIDNTQVKTNIAPNLNWSLQATGYVDTNYTAINNSDDIHSWVWSGTIMYHWYTRYGQTINTVNVVDNTDYDWDDGNQDNNLMGASNGTHQWDDPGYYDVQIVIEDECVATVTGTDQIQIFNHAPTADITMTPGSPDPNTPVSFQWTGTDVDSTISGIDWVIGDSGIYGNTNTTTIYQSRDDTIPHSNGLGTDWCGQGSTSGAFTNPGTHNVAIVMHWWDGFTMQTLNYNENFDQSRFGGPTVDFTQLPAQAIMASGVKFTNTSSNTSRVGLGLPDCDEYDWTWTDDGVSNVELDKPYSFELERTPDSVNCQVQLCADWSDGWDTNQVCVDKDVVFATTVTVTEENCYYNLNVVGTSDDGSVTDYSWTIASGISNTGPWIDTWSSPINIDQNDKKICFTSQGWYRITGYVYGTGATTSDDEIMYITEVCPSVSVFTLWNGTGVLDHGGDWNHSGYGSEEAYAMYAGTNGLDTGNLNKNHRFKFINPDGYVDINEYNMLSMWVDVKSWQSGKNMQVQFQGPGGWLGDLVNLNAYIDIHTINSWQHALIPLGDFNLCYVVKKLSHDNGSSGELYIQINGGVWELLSDDYNSVPDGEVLAIVGRYDTVVIKLISNWHLAPPEILSTDDSLCQKTSYDGGTRYGFEDWPGGDNDYNDYVMWIGPQTSANNVDCDISMVHKLRFTSKGNIRFYLDNIQFVVGSVFYTPISVCEPDVASEELGVKTMTGVDIRPSMRADNPDVSAGKVVLRAYPLPRNL